MPRLIPVDNVDGEQSKKLRLVPVKKQETSARLVPVQPVQPERTKIDQPLLKEANTTSIKDVPEGVLLAAKQMIVDFPLAMGSFIGGATYDAYDALLKGKFSFENARKAHENMSTMSQAAYSKVRSLVPIGDQAGAEQIVNNIFAPLEKFATKGGEIVTDLTDSPIAGATAYGTLQVLPWVIGAKAVGMGIGGAKNVVEGITQKNLAPRMTALREAGKDVPVEIENPKQPLIDAKAAIVSTISEKFKEAEKISQEQTAQSDQQVQNPELQQKVQELKTLKEVNESLGIVNAGEIPEGKVVDLKSVEIVQPGATTEPKGKPTYAQILREQYNELVAANASDEAFSHLSRTSGESVRSLPRKGESWEQRADRVIKGFEERDARKIINLKPQKIDIPFKKGLINIGNVEPVKADVLQFTATNNIKEQQKTLATAKQDVVKTVQEEGTKPISKDARRNLIKERVEAAKASRLKEIEELSHYEDTPDPLTVDTQKTVKDASYKEPETVAKAVTLQDINVLAKKNEIGVNANIGANGDMIVSVTDKYGNKADFPLTKGGVTLQDVHNFVNNWTDDFAQSMKKQYEVKTEVIENAPELVKLSGVTKKHIIPSTGETIEYLTVGDLKMAYEQRGLPWISSKKAYYTKKKIDEATKAEIDNKLTPISQKSLPEIELLDSQGNGKKPGMLQWMEPFRFVAQDIEQRTGFPIQQFESKIRDGSRQVSGSVVPYMKRLRAARSGINRESELRIYRALERPAFRESGGDFNIFRRTVNGDKELSGILGDMTRTEYESAGKIRKILNDAAEEYNIPLDKMVLDYAPRMMREGVSGWTEAIKKWQLPEEYKWAALEERMGYMRPHEEQIFKVADSYIRRGATKRYIGNYLEELSNQLNKTKFESKADIDQLNKYVATMRGWQTGFDESIRTSGETIARILNKAINAPSQMFGGKGSQRYRNISYQKMDIEQKMINPETGEMENVKIPRYVKTGEESGFFNIYTAANDFVNLHLKLSYAGALAWRPMVWARAMWQSTLALPIVGPRWFAKGMAKVGSPDAWHEAKAATALFAESPVAGGELSRGWTIMDDITQMSTWDTRAGHNIGRLIAYHAGKEKAAFYGKEFLENIKKGMTEDKAISKYLDDSDADFFHPTLIKNEIIPLLKAKDVTSLSERMGLHTTAETQWLYEKGQAPYWARSVAGKVMGQFGVWPSWYIKYVRNLATRGSKWNRAKRLAGLATINLMTYEIGKEVFGVDVSGWTVTHPFVWAPLPVQTIDAMRKTALGHSDWEKEQGESELMNMAAMHIPGYLSARSIVRGLEESRDEDAFKVMMGFKAAEEK